MIPPSRPIGHTNQESVKKKSHKKPPLPSAIMTNRNEVIHIAIGVGIIPIANHAPLERPLLSVMGSAQYGEFSPLPPNEVTSPLSRVSLDAEADPSPQGSPSPGEISIASGFSSTSSGNSPLVLNHAPEMPKMTFSTVNAFLWSHVFGMSWKAAPAAALPMPQSRPRAGKCPSES